VFNEIIELLSVEGQSSTYSWLDPAVKSMGATTFSPQESQW